MTLFQRVVKVKGNSIILNTKTKQTIYIICLALAFLRPPQGALTMRNRFPLSPGHCPFCCRLTRGPPYSDVWSRKGCPETFYHFCRVVVFLIFAWRASRFLLFIFGVLSCTSGVLCVPVFFRGCLFILFLL